jgi:hypothetical protein
VKTIKADYVAMLLDAARRNIASRHNRKRSGTAPKKAASWLMTLVMDLEQADAWENDEPEKEGK